MKPLTRLLSVVALAVLGFLVDGSTRAAVDLSFPAEVVSISPPISELSFGGIDYGPTDAGDDDRAATTTWRMVRETGNCCENYLAITPTGRLVDFGGDLLRFTDDRGLTWQQVEPLNGPLGGGEGAVVVAPNGDILGAVWDYSEGDRLIAVKFDAESERWLHSEIPVHAPDYDREWISVVPGPITVGGATHEYASFIEGGHLRDIWFYSTDGINYIEITSREIGRLVSGRTVEAPLPTTPSAANDWTQPLTAAGVIPLGGGRALAAPDAVPGGGANVPWSLLDQDFSWARYRVPGGADPAGQYQVDSAGRVHRVVIGADRSGFEYSISGDGGLTWSTTAVPLPRNHVFAEAAFGPALDFRAHGAAGVAAVAVRARELQRGTERDLVFKLDIGGAVPRLARRHEIGLGDLSAAQGYGEAVRFDFESVAIFPDGRVAVSFLDSTTTNSHYINNTPAVAIEGDTVLGGSPPPEPADPVVGNAYASHHFDSDAEGWTAAGYPSWTRSAPGTKDGSDDVTSMSFAVGGPMVFTEKVNARLTSLPVHAEAGRAVVAFWIKTELVGGFDFLTVEWSGDGELWNVIRRYTGKTQGYPNWVRETLGFDSPGGDVQVRFRFTANPPCSFVGGPECTPTDVYTHAGVRIDEVVLAEQAGSTLVAGALAVSNGDGDEFLDNCEAGTLGFSIANIGNRPLTNVRVLGASPISHPAVAVTAVRFDPTDLALGEAASGEIDLRAAAMRHGDTLVLEVTYAADELGGEPERRTIEVRDVESDMTFRPEVAWSFEGGMDGWQVVQGTFGPQSLPPLGAPSAGGAPSRGYMASSSLADGVCDQVRSPRVRLTATSAVSLYAAYEIEPSSDKAYDRANLALADGSPGGRRVVAPGAGLRRYEVTGGNYSGCTSGQPGWNGIGPGWLDAQWSPADLDVTNLPAAGKDYFLEITYGTDSNTAGPGFRFDEVRAKNVLVAAPDTQNDECTP